MRKISLLLLMVSQTINAYAQPSSVEVNAYTTHYYPIKNAQLAAHIYYLDDVELLEEQLSHQLSANPQIAENQIRQKMQTIEWKKTEQALAQAYIGVTEGWKNGITKVPAVLFTNTDTGKRAVIYGETDIARAIQRYRQTINF
ncbi:TIGR03757 family integrating conjugative element protein [Rodentibacter myodis]|uniref:Integrating conjugative element protein n=1 Tax=Rodentibacter myodis TaxID=1907939 RepID=A0A1V3JSE1_9PAST|nr:TIGR03757 family integrating conjugative element protein [Rodentibacter myodis]OOF59715.1 integrating conjugative element protein [Rodentibacter myodis]